MAKIKPPADPQTCRHCTFGHFDPGEDVGECRRYPRTLVVVNDDATAMFTVAYADEACGEFRRKLDD